jgi:very-short-patch-repair endonuclease
MEIVLLKLKIGFQKEVNISNRFIDFIIEDNIILELDGTIHTYPFHFENDDVTCYRNLHLVLAGYRLVVISIYEYNMHREVDELAALLLRKLKLLKEEDCIAVL